MRPHYGADGLSAYLDAVPLPIPRPPGPPSDWTCLYAELGPRLCFARAHFQDLADDALLGGLLEALGRPAPREESRWLRLVTPIPAGHSLPDLVAAALAGPHSAEAALLLGHLGHTRAEPLLIQALSGEKHITRAEAAKALGRLGVGAPVLRRWDGDTDAERLWALVVQGVFPEELPAGELDVLAGLITERDPTATRELLGQLGSLPDPLPAIVGEGIARHPELAAELAEALCEELPRATDHDEWTRAIAAAGEEIHELLAERFGDGDWRVRMGAAMVASELEALGPALQEALRKATSDDDGDVRREAALALAVHGEPLRVEVWTDQFQFLERAAVHPWAAALTGSPVPREMFALLARRDNGAVLARAALAMAFAHPRLAAPTLEALVRDDGIDVPLDARRAAAAGLLVTGTPPTSTPGLHRLLLRDIGNAGGSADGLAPEELAAIAGRDGDWQVRLAALHQLDHTGSAGRFDALLAKLARTDSDSDVRRKATGMRVPRFSAPDPSGALARVIVGSRVEADSQGTALAELATRDPELAAGMAIGMLEHPDRNLALAAARLVGAQAHPDDAERWARRGLAMLGSPSWVPREVGAALLGALDGAGLPEELVEEALEALEAASSTDDDLDVRRMAGGAHAALRRR